MAYHGPQEEREKKIRAEKLERERLRKEAELAMQRLQGKPREDMIIEVERKEEGIKKYPFKVTYEPQEGNDTNDTSPPAFNEPNITPEMKKNLIIKIDLSSEMEEKGNEENIMI
ncbi:MAG: hypothetical protein MJ252_04225 [archaeon]|nr:hypothetical protein [archaeon]